ncbi:hypothetical protein KY342_00835 [Candidatus Woesearchaeota archaeon]|nr:hypothetical protein [Candidatus Woesearchaeota archaeon]
MRKTIFISILIMVLVLAGCQQQVEQQATQPQQPAPTQPTTPKVSADNVDTIPQIDISACLAQIKQTNPEMSDQDANDNCYAIEAINKGDKSLCNRVVNADIKSACLAQFS